MLTNPLIFDLLLFKFITELVIQGEMQKIISIIKQRAVRFRQQF